jgi:hypothetical protein
MTEIHDKLRRQKELRNEVRDLQLSNEELEKQMEVLKNQLDTKLVDLEIQPDADTGDVSALIQKYDDLIYSLTKQIASNEVMINVKRTAIQDIEQKIEAELHRRKTETVKQKVRSCKDKLALAKNEYELAKSKIFEAQQELVELAGLEPSSLEHGYLLSGKKFFHNKPVFVEPDNIINTWDSSLNSMFMKLDRDNIAEKISNWHLDDYMGVE